MIIDRQTIDRQRLLIEKTKKKFRNKSTNSGFSRSEKLNSGLAVPSSGKFFKLSYGTIKTSFEKSQL